MKYVEEKSPSGYSFRLFPESGQMIIFDRRGKTVNLSGAPFGELIRIPFICLTGRNMLLKTELYRDYSILKVRNGKLIVPYVDRYSLKTSYYFTPSDIKLDMIPVRMALFNDASAMMKTLKEDTVIDRIFFDRSVSGADEELIMHRYRVQESFRLTEEHKSSGVQQTVSVTGGNPVFLACEYIRKADMAGLKTVLERAVLTITDMDCIEGAFMAYYSTLSTDHSGEEQTVQMKACLDFCSALNRRNMQMINDLAAGNLSGDFCSFCLDIIRKERSVLPAADRTGLKFLEDAEKSVMNSLSELNQNKEEI